MNMEVPTVAGKKIAIVRKINQRNFHFLPRQLFKCGPREAILFFSVFHFFLSHLASKYLLVSNANFFNKSNMQQK